MSYVVNPDGTHKEVLNLGWLLRHWNEVESFEVIHGSTQFVITDPDNGNYLWRIPEPPNPSMDSVMVAHLKNRGAYVTRWASYKVMLDWLHRPKFIGLPIKWFGLRTEIK